MTAGSSVPGSRSEGPSSVDRAFLSGARWLTISTLLVGVTNYGFGLLMTHVLDVDDYAVFAAAQGLLLVAGTIAFASIPRMLARDLVRAGDDLGARREVVWFASVVNLFQGVLGAALVALLAAQFAGPRVVAVAAAAGGLVFVGAIPLGWVQGERRFRLLGVMRVVEVAIKAGLGFLLALAGAGAAGAIAGVGLGALCLAVWGGVLMRRDVRVVRGVLRRVHHWRSAFGIAGIQGLVAVFSSVDIVLVPILASEGGDAANYQVSMTLARAPLFLASAVATVVFPLFRPDAAEAGGLFRGALRKYALMVVPFAIALATAPPVLLAIVFPEAYDQLPTLLIPTSVAGGLIGLISLLATFYQSSGWYRRALRLQAVGLAFHLPALVVGWSLGGVVGLAIGAAVGAGVTALLLYRDARRRWVGERSGRLALPWPTWSLLAVVLMSVPAPLWLAVALAAGGWAAYAGLVRRDPRTPRQLGEEDDAIRPKVLHLGFEDHRRPGSGGGSVRTHQVNRRLADRFDVTVLTTSWPGAEDRVEDGVRYVHIGSPRGHWASLLSYFAVLPFHARRHAADLVVEDFAAPFSSSLSPLWDPRPKLAVVQWLNAREKSRQYKLPFFLVESLGVRLHGRYVAVSDDLAETIRQRNPRAVVTPVPNGVEAESFEVDTSDSGDVVYLGRLEIAQKGCDLLLEAFARVADRTDAQLILAGDGPDRRKLAQMADALGIADRVVFAGRVDGRAKHELLAGARLVAMPSRFETFGMVAVEALACGTAVLAFEIPCLRAVVPPDCGELVPPFDVSAYADRLLALLTDPDRTMAMGARGRDFARAYDWDVIADQQAEVYLEVLPHHEADDEVRGQPVSSSS
jgi:glycosyltransferase involved in cell wall biosynthesis/O-antigen/teichoic acid export membrane protein